jgi:hypothetical protein
MKQTVRPLAKEEEVLKDLSLHFCPASSESSRKTLFWLPASDETIEYSEAKFNKYGYPSVVPNGEFFASFPDYWTRFNPERSPIKSKP